MDKIQQRCSEGKCPICKCEEIKEKRTVDYKGENIDICKEHPYLEEREVTEKVKKVRNKYKHKRRSK